MTETELMGTLRPVKWQQKAASYADVEIAGDVLESVRYVEDDQAGITRILEDTVELPYVADSVGFGLFDQGGNLEMWWPQIAAGPDARLQLAGLAFSRQFSPTDIAAPAHAHAAGRG